MLFTKRVLTFLSMFGALLAHSSVSAQESSFTLGSPMKENPGNDYVFFDPIQKKSYWIDNKLDYLTLTVADNYLTTGSVPKQVRLGISRGKDPIYLHKFFLLNDKIYVVYSTYGKDRATMVYAQELSKDLKVQGPPLRMAKFDDAAEPPSDYVYVDDKLVRKDIFFVGLSHNQQWLVFVRERKNKLEVRAFAMDKKSEMTSQVIPLDTDFQFRIDQLEVTGNGNVYITGNYFKKENNGPVNPVIVACTVGKNTYKVHAIQDDKIDYAPITIHMLPGDTPLFGGVYNNTALKEVGYRLYKMDPGSYELKTFASAPLTKAYAELTDKGVVAYKGHSRPAYFCVSDLLVLPEGNLIFTIDWTVAHSSLFASTEYNPPIYVVSLNGNGVEQWNSTIEKSKIDGDAGDFAGHRLIYRGHKVYMIYNDNPASLYGLKMDKALKFRVNVTAVEFDAKGGVQRVNLAGSVKEKFSAIYAQSTYIIDNNLMQCLFKVDDTYRFATISIGD